MPVGARRGPRPMIGALALTAVALLAGTAAAAAPLSGAARSAVMIADAPSSEWWLATLRVADAWQYSKGAGVTVAVVDSGVQASLPVLQGQVLPGQDFTGQGGDARTDSQDTDFSQPYGHGTAMASLIAATGAGGGFVGVAPAAKILPVRVTPAGGRPDPNAVDPGIKWAVDHGAKIVNVSLGAQLQGCVSDNQASVDYVNQHGAILVAATGDHGAYPPDSPAACTGALGVGAVDQSFTPWSDQSAGAGLNFVEPGVTMATPGLDGKSVLTSGTSNSAALLSGVLALVWSKFPTETPRQIVTRLLYNLKNDAGQARFGTRINDDIGYGMPLPFFALTEAPPAQAKNPIYDAVDARLQPSPSRSSSGSGSYTTGSPDSASGSSSGQTVARALIGGVVLLVLIMLVVLVVTRRRRRPPPPYSGGYPPPGYGPPQ